MTLDDDANDDSVQDSDEKVVQLWHVETLAVTLHNADHLRSLYLDKAFPQISFDDDQSDEKEEVIDKWQ
ncbi:hypothetical protein GcM1_242102 [Golovinomyces cichoracearum]|uniref:Uncharacterized protein n=1 Tax=Golovinomyces cichoracearum TaxID=62708 RepID=A0A420IH75_9PEZI|nr:hypothetical protein GcM1_242102 [Golovinomyces cichoracearum]